MPGWSAYVSENEYQQHIATYVDQTEVSVCFFFFLATLNNSKKNLTDKYMRFATRCVGQSQYPFFSRVRSFGGWIGYMF